MTKEIQLTQGKVALVDDDWFDYLSQWKWFCDKGIYAARSQLISDGKKKIVYMHSVVANTPKGMNTDHIDMNGLNNQSNNLRVCTKSQNMGNINRAKTNTSGYKNVRKHSKCNKWQVEVGKKYIGLYDSLVEAAHAADVAAKKYYGVFARLNFPEDKK